MRVGNDINAPSAFVAMRHHLLSGGGLFTPNSSGKKNYFARGHLQLNFIFLCISRRILALPKVKQDYNPSTSAHLILQTRPMNIF
jgi:hypothetical protein